MFPNFVDFHEKLTKVADQTILLATNMVGQLRILNKKGLSLLRMSYVFASAYHFLMLTSNSPN